ncbi:hypothetical protein ACH4FX_41960 [Streptomyces sp. NPDC018019]|uniref:hypothetical protein n=1 Tax=Streptomyces sp. NPDC018019 TaxID=3365030 RepID=UPI0037A9196B
MRNHRKKAAVGLAALAAVSGISIATAGPASAENRHFPTKAACFDAGNAAMAPGNIRGFRCRPAGPGDFVLEIY